MMEIRERRKGGGERSGGGREVISALLNVNHSKQQIEAGESEEVHAGNDTPVDSLPAKSYRARTNSICAVEVDEEEEKV